MVGKNLPALHEAQVTKCRILQRDMSVPIDQQNDESHYDDNGIQHEKTTVPSSDGRINGLGAKTTE